LRDLKNIFVDKPSGTCQRSSSSRKLLIGDEKWIFWKSLKIDTIINISHDLYTVFRVFDFLDFLYNQIELCEISKIFSRQTIWDLSEKFQLQENTDGRWIVYLLEIAQFVTKSSIFSHNLCVILGFSTFRTCCIIRLSFARSQKYFLDKQSETCRKSSSCREYAELGVEVGFSESLHYAMN